MQHLPEKWLRRFNYYYIAFCTLSVGIYVYFAISEGSLKIGSPNPFGTSLATAGVAAACLLYNLIFLRIMKRYSLWIAYGISFLLFGITNSAATEIALGTHGGPFFLVNGYLVSLASVCFGPLAVLAVIGVNSVVYAMILGGTTTPSPLGVVGDGLVLFAKIAVSGILLFALREKFRTDKNDKLNYIERYFVTSEVVKLLTNSIGDGVIIIDQKQIVRAVNPAALKLIEKSSKDILELNYRSVLKLKNMNNTEIDPTQEPVAAALKSQQPASREYLLIKDDRSSIYVDVTISVIADPATKAVYGAVIIIRDVSKRKQEEAARSEFISTASHEMRTPVAAIEGFIELALNEKVCTIDPKARSYLEKARGSTQHLGQLFQDLLVSAKAEDGRLSSHPTVIELGELLEQQVEGMKFVAQQRNLQIEFIISSAQNNMTKHETLKTIKPLYYAFADGDRVKEVVTNLIDNAIKYTQEGKITVGLTGNDEVVQFFVKDTGIGIPQEDLPHLFQKFYRVDSSATRTTGGTGLGLFISKKIIGLYNGNIWAESQRSRGTTFYVNLPRLSATQAQTINQKQSLSQASSPAQNTSQTNGVAT